MTDFDYPPAREVTLAQARDDVAESLTDAEGEVDRLEDDDDATESALAEARSEVEVTENRLDALGWAVDVFGDDATIALRAFTTTTRSRVLDTLQRKTVGPVGPNRTEDWLTAAGVTTAPWLDGDEDLQKQAAILGELPPALSDWLNDQLSDLNDLSEGN